MAIYKIRSKTTGLCSTGGRDPEFKKNGKTWNQLNHVRSHVTMIRDTVKYGGFNKESNAKLNAYLADIEIIRVTVTETVQEIEVISI